MSWAALLQYLESPPEKPTEEVDVRCCVCKADVFESDTERSWDGLYVCGLCIAKEVVRPCTSCGLYAQQLVQVDVDLLCTECHALDSDSMLVIVQQEAA